MGALIRAFDWTTTPLGPIAGWPQSLRTAVDIVLRSPVPLVMLWGRDGIMIYNDAYSVFAGGRHPQLLGSKVLEGWPEVADLNRRVMDVGLRGETLSFRDEHLVLHRSGRPEDLWVNLDYSPLLDENGKPAGVLAVVVETTERVRAEKALRESEAQFRTFASVMPNHVWSATPEGKLDWFNHQVHEYTGAGAGRARRRPLGRGGPSRRSSSGPSPFGPRPYAKAPTTKSSSACATPPARIAGTWRAPCPSATLPARSSRWIGTNTDIDDQIRIEARTARPRSGSRARPADRQGRRR